MSTPRFTTLVERYLVERRRLGFQLSGAAYWLRSFARHVQAAGHRGPLTVEIMAEWARWTASSSMAGKTTFILAGWTGMNVVG
ncbi:MAG: hypothetical protein E6H52_21185 [Betaproteobacteria bacterium]|nr:MAG: hypothetical protein E6H52_21185 [Betaproteobacteria bacterium]